MARKRVRQSFGDTIASDGDMRRRRFRNDDLDGCFRPGKLSNFRRRRESLSEKAPPVFAANGRRNVIDQTGGLVRPKGGETPGTSQRWTDGTGFRKVRIETPDRGIVLGAFRRCPVVRPAPNSQHVHGTPASRAGTVHGRDFWTRLGTCAIFAAVSFVPRVA